MSNIKVVLWKFLTKHYYHWSLVVRRRRPVGIPSPGAACPRRKAHSCIWGRSPPPPWRCTDVQMCTDVYRCVQRCTDVYRCVHILSRRCLPGFEPVAALSGQVNEELREVLGHLHCLSATAIYILCVYIICIYYVVYIFNVQYYICNI